MPEAEDFLNSRRRKTSKKTAKSLFLKAICDKQLPDGPFIENLQTVEKLERIRSALIPTDKRSLFLQPNCRRTDEALHPANRR
ncbi:hypothetical protein SynRS9907_02727 [Synechococcus sp. RS9907]|nr:hypothetical protein SynRS9907_02727 [Synechococcus sp. RS9907]